MQVLFENMKWMLETQQLGITLDELSERMQLGNWEAQHLFQEYLGKDPLRFVQDAFSPSLANVVQTTQTSIFDSFDEDEEVNDLLPIEIVLMESVETIQYFKFPYFLGELFIASCEKGICQVTFEDEEDGFARLKKTYSNAVLIEERSELQETAFEVLCSYFVAAKKPIEKLPIAVKGTQSQLSVWKELAQLKMGELATYGTLALAMGDVNASRAVGTAVGANPVALFIPCHRIVQNSGKIGQFRWGTWRKQILLAIEK